MKTTTELIPTGRVARMLGVSQNWVRALDGELSPQVGENGRRMYRLDVVERYAARRDAERSR